MSAASRSSFEAPHSAQTWRQKGHRVLLVCCKATCQKNLQDTQIQPKTVNGLRRFSIIAKTPVNSHEFTVNLVNLAYLCLSGGFGSRCLLLGCFWHLKGLNYMYCTYKNIMLGSPGPKEEGLCFSDLLNLLLGGSGGNQKPQKVS